jgi:hypothetical protein
MNVENIKKFNNILFWFNKLSIKLNFNYWLDLSTLFNIYYYNNLKNLSNIYVSTLITNFNVIVSYLIENKIVFKWSNNVFSKFNVYYRSELNSFIQIDDLIIIFWIKENNYLTNNRPELVNYKIDENLIFELKTFEYDDKNYFIPNETEEYLKLIKLKKDNIEKTINYKFNLNKNKEEYSEEKVIENENNVENIVENNEIQNDKIKKNYLLTEILKRRDNSWTNYEKSLINQNEIEEKKYIKNIDRKNQLVPKFFSL